MGLKEISPGVESGGGRTPDRISKGYHTVDILEQCKKLTEAGIGFRLCPMRVRGECSGCFNGSTCHLTCPIAPCSVPGRSESKPVSRSRRSVLRDPYGTLYRLIHLLNDCENKAMLGSIGLCRLVQISAYRQTACTVILK